MHKNNVPEDRQEPVHDLEDIIDARDERRSAFADDIDEMPDIQIPDEIDVDDALTFPHPHSKKKKRRQAVDLPDTSDEIAAAEENEVDFDYEDSVDEMLPTDYAGDYNEALTTDVTDDDDAVVEDIIDRAGDLDTDDILYEDTIPEPLPRNFQGESE